MNFYEILLGCLGIFWYGYVDLGVPERYLTGAAVYLELIDGENNPYLDSDYFPLALKYHNYLCDLIYAPWNAEKDRFRGLDIFGLIDNRKQFLAELTERTDIIGGNFKARMRQDLRYAEENVHMLGLINKAMNHPEVYYRRLALQELRDNYGEVYRGEVVPMKIQWKFGGL